MGSSCCACLCVLYILFFGMAPPLLLHADIVDVHKNDTYRIYGGLTEMIGEDSEKCASYVLYFFLIFVPIKYKCNEVEHNIEYPDTTSLLWLKIFSFSTYIAIIPTIPIGAVYYCLADYPKTKVLFHITGFLQAIGFYIQIACLVSYFKIYGPVFGFSVHDATIPWYVFLCIYGIGCVITLWSSVWGLWHTIRLPYTLGKKLECKKHMKDFLEWFSAIRCRCCLRNGGSKVPEQHDKDTTTTRVEASPHTLREVRTERAPTPQRCKRCDHTLNHRNNYRRRNHRAHNEVRVQGDYIAIQYDPVRHSDTIFHVERPTYHHPDNAIPVTDIIDMLVGNWKPRHVGRGRDARNLRHDNFEVDDIDICQNGDLFRQYAYIKGKFFKAARGVGGEFKPPELYGDAIKPIATTGPIRRIVALKGNINSSINEYYLFHGTKPDCIESIMTDGFKMSKYGMLGKGIYLTDETVKADQYSRPDEDGFCYMLLCRVLLGDLVILTQAGGHGRATSPPCKECLLNVNVYPGASYVHDSLVYTGGLFREYVVYDSHQVYPEFVIKYRRLTNDSYV